MYLSDFWIELVYSDEAAGYMVCVACRIATALRMLTFTREPLAQRHGVTYPNTWSVRNTAEETSNLTLWHRNFYIHSHLTLPPSALLRKVRWFKTDVSGLLIGPVLTARDVREEQLELWRGEQKFIPETSVSNHLTSHNNPEVWRIQFDNGGSLRFHSHCFGAAVIEYSDWLWADNPGFETQQNECRSILLILYIFMICTGTTSSFWVAISSI